MRVGYGIRHPELVSLLVDLEPAATHLVTWGDGTISLQVTAYLADAAAVARVPDMLIGSARCLVRVNGRIVTCDTPDGPHVLPGGRREVGETYEATACREVHEETGWMLAESDLRTLGFLHMRHHRPQPVDHPHPHPDFIQLVYTAEATRQDGDRGGAWVDAVGGWETGHRLLTLDELAAEELPSSQLAFLEAPVP